MRKTIFLITQFCNARIIRGPVHLCIVYDIGGQTLPHDTNFRGNSKIAKRKQ